MVLMPGSRDRSWVSPQPLSTRRSVEEDWTGSQKNEADEGAGRRELPPQLHVRRALAGAPRS